MGRPLTIEEIKSRTPKNSRLVVVDFDGYCTYPNSKPAKMLKCVCECGVEVRIRLIHFLKGSIVSCGCKKRNDTINRNTKYRQHSITYPKINMAYHGMMSRCYNPKNKQYKNYGGRGVVVCEEWRNNYESFLKWALSNGWQEGYDLDKDTKGDGMLYSPETCCFIPKSINRGFTRRTKKISHNGAILSHRELCQVKGIDPTTVNSRIERGWSFEDAINLPLRKNQYQ